MRHRLVLRLQDYHLLLVIFRSERHWIPGEGKSLFSFEYLIRFNRGFVYNFSALPRTVGTYPPPLGTAWPIKTDPALDARREADERERERQLREREERERQKREREERERREREREEKLRKEQQEREQKERERERKEKERREMERREMERERHLQQQRMNESSKAAIIRDRSPLRNGNEVDMRVKEEPRKDEELMMRADPRFHQQMAAWNMAGRHPAHVLPPPHFSRSMLPPSAILPHYAPGPTGWPSPLDPYRDPYRFDPMRYGPMLDAIRAEEAKQALSSAYAAAHYRAKDPSPVPQSAVPSSAGPPPPQQHHRMPPGPLKPPMGGMNMNVTPGAPPPGLQVSVDLHKKEDSTQAR